MKKYILLFLALESFLRGATTYFVTQSGAGSANGSTLGNAWSAANFNNSSNWSGTPGTAGKISPGDTVSLNGTITSSLTAQGGGSAGNVITILFASGAKMSAPFWTGQAFQTSSPYITIDGGTNGIIECTANGTGLANQVDCTGVYILSATNVTVQNLTIQNIYVRTAGTETNGFGNCIFANSSSTNCSNFLATNNVCSNAANGIIANFGDGATNIVYTNNTVSYCNWSYNIGDRGSVTNSLTGAVITGNSCSQWANWNETATNSFHHNGVFLFANQGTITSPIVANNFFGSGLGGTYQTAQVFANNGITNLVVFNNVFSIGSGESVSNGIITIGAIYTATNISVYNNTFIMAAGSTGGDCVRLDESLYHQGGTWTVRNNIFQGPWGANINWLPGASAATWASNHNIFFSAPNFKLNDGGSFNLATWKAIGSNFDADAVTTDPKVDGTYHILSGSSAIGAGANLTALSITLLNSDKAGSARPSGATAWDNGVYNFSGGGSTGSSALSGKVLLTGKVTIK